MSLQLVKRLLVLAFVAILPACKLAVIVDEGGDVKADVSGFDCDEFTNCVFIVEDTSFKVEFTAVPKSGFAFSHWQGGPGYLCAGSANPACELDASIPGIENEIASDKTYSIRPVFVSEQGASGTRIVVMDADPAGSKVVGEVVGDLIVGPMVLVPIGGTQVLLDLNQVLQPPNVNVTPEQVWFDQPACQGTAFILGNRVPFFSETLSQAKLITRSDKAGERELWVLSAGTPPATFTALSQHANNQCIPWLTEPTSSFPLELLVEDFDALFPAPYRIESR